MTLVVRPIVAWPRAVAPGRRYLMTVDLERADDVRDWPYDTEEVVVHCLLDAGDGLVSRPVGEPAVVLHRFGGTYGPARFVLTSRSGATAGFVRVTLVNDNGVPMRVFDLGDVHISPREAEQESHIELPEELEPATSSVPERPRFVRCTKLEISIEDETIAWEVRSAGSDQFDVAAREPPAREPLSLPPHRRVVIDRLVAVLRRAANVDDGTSLEGAGYRDILATMGTELFELLFAGPVRQELARQLDVLRLGQTEVLSVTLSSFAPSTEESWLASLPWEYLHFPEGDTTFGPAASFLSDVRGLVLSRRLSGLMRALDADALPIRVLLVSSSPTTDEQAIPPTGWTAIVDALQRRESNSY